MSTNREILRTLRAVEAQQTAMLKLSERVSALELWLYWLRGAWAALAALYAYLFRSNRCN
jgi:hypothetical protein